MAGRVLFYVQHLLGIGHLVRASAIARCMAEAGLAVDLVSGGMPVPGLGLGPVNLLQLPPLRSGTGGFRDLVDDTGSRVDGAWKAARRDRLLELFRDRAPDALVIEAFPFGRRQMRFELAPLLDAAHARHPRPVVVASVRDILQVSRKPERDAETAATVNACFDHVMVHGDPRLVRLEDSFSRAGEIADKLCYTGMVAASHPGGAGGTGQGEGKGEVVVSVGGGAIGRELLFVAMQARPLTRLGDAPWRLITGPNLADGDFSALADAALAADTPSAVTVERHRDDFTELLAHCRVSVSHCGYNTAVDVLGAGCPSVMVPYSVGGETEQTARATRLAERRLIQMVGDSRLSPQTLSRAIDAAMDAPPADANRIDLDGAAESARLVAAWLSA